MVTSYSGSTVLKTYRLNSDEEKSYILGFPYIVGSTKGRSKDVGYTVFSKTVIKNIKERAINRGSLDLVIEQSANSAVRTNSWNLQTDKIHDGFFFPKLWGSASPGDLERVKQCLNSKELIAIRYLSSRIGASGSPVLIEKIYVGRITGIAEDETLATVHLGESDYRSFHIDQMIQLGHFADRFSDGEMLYLHLKLTPREKGGTLLTWSTIRGENHPFLTQPFHRDSAALERKRLIEEKTEKGKSEPPEDDFEDFLIPRGGEIDWEGLERHLGKYVRVEVYSKDFHQTTYYFKLRKMIYTPEYKRLLLQGDGETIEQPIQNLVIASVKRKKKPRE